MVVRSFRELNFLGMKFPLLRSCWPKGQSFNHIFNSSLAAHSNFDYLLSSSNCIIKILVYKFPYTRMPQSNTCITSWRQMHHCTFNTLLKCSMLVTCHLHHLLLSHTLDLIYWRVKAWVLMLTNPKVFLLWLFLIPNTTTPDMSRVPLHHMCCLNTLGSIKI
jgi:hypothetical protein